MNLSKYAKYKIEKWQDLLNLNEDEQEVYNLLAKGKTIKEICFTVEMSASSVSARISSIKKKMKQVGIDLKKEINS